MKTQWNLDPMHSEVNFRVKHLVISTVSGSFSKFEATAETDGDNFETAQVRFSADVNSISTNQEQRDGHLKSPDFFDVANHPTLTFVSKSVKKTGEDKYIISGDLTIRGTTKTIDLHVEHGGVMKDPYGNIKAGFEVTGSINRKEYGLNWSAVTEAGGIVVSDEVKFSANVQFAKVVAATA